MNPLFDARFWLLLRDVLVDSDVTKSRSVRPWLLPILQRTPLAPIAIALFAAWATHRTSRASSTQFSAAAECLSYLWPLAVTKFTSENLLECLAAAVHLLCEYPQLSTEINTDAQSHILHIVGQIIASYRYAFANTSNKKKACNFHPLCTASCPR